MKEDRLRDRENKPHESDTVWQEQRRKVREAAVAWKGLSAPANNNR